MSRSLTERAGKIDPVISLSTRIYDVIMHYWPQLFSIFVAAGGMSVLAFLTATIRVLGPAGIGAIGLISGLLAWTLTTYIQYLRAKRYKIYAETSAINKWKEDVDKINPLEQEFRKSRINLNDLKHPITGLILNKRFIDCEFFGPANLIFLNANLNGGGFNGCDIVVSRSKVMIHNAVGFVNAQVYKCHFWNCTIFIPPDLVSKFKDMGGHFISFTLDQELDNIEDETPKGYIQPTDVKHG